MSGSAGGNRITRESVAKTVDSYINRILKKFPAFKSAKISGSYNTSAKEDFGDIDLIVNLKSTDKKNIKLELAKFLSALPDDVIVPFKSEKYKGKKYLNTGEIITILYPIEGQPDQYVQIDNIVSISDDEAEFKKEFLDYPAEIQGLLLGLAKVICLEEDPKSIFARMGISNIPELEANQEYEFNLSSAGLTLRIVTLDNFKEVDRTDVWKTSNWSNIKKLFTNYKIDGKFEDLLNDISSKVKNPRSKNRIKGVFNSMVSIKSGEVGTPKGDNKQKSLDKVNNMLNETNLGRHLVSLLLEQDQPTVALYPGKFKPPHKGHFEVLYKLLNVADEVIVLISPKTHEGITAQESAKIWNLYKSLLPDGNKVKLKISEVTPVRDVYDYIEANPEQTVYAAYGKGEEDRYKNLKKYSNAKVFDAGSAAFDNGENISATNFRQALLSKDKEKIKEFIPTGISVDDVLTILSNPINESKSQRLDESQTATIGEFIKYACKDLGIQKLPSRLTLSYDTDAAREKRSFGYFDPNNNQIWVYVKNRNMADILRTLAHELVHRKQDEDGRIDYESGETGSDIENEANAQAGVLLRDYGKVDNGIYEAKKK
jgi:cytidyltransferase-like protein